MGKVLDRKGHEAQFLETVFSDILVDNPDLRILIWTIPGTHRANESRFFENPVAAGDWCREVEEKRDVYFALGLRDTNIPDGKRGGEREVRGIAGFAIDLDLRNDKRGKQNLFENRQEVLDLLGSLRNKPTLIVQSGNGMHAYWLFHEPWIFENDEDWMQARRMSLGWQRHIKDKVDYEIDSTHTLDRIWRVPGTYNHKYDPAVLVEIVHHDDFARYEPTDDFGMFAVALETAGSIGMSDRMEIDVDLHVAVPDCVKNMLATNEDFARTWHHIKRIGDSSQSGYDFAIGHIGREAGWSADEVLAAIVSNRRMKSGNMKRDNMGYYSLTMTKIFGTEFSQKESEKQQTPLDQFKKVVGIPIKEIQKFGAQEGRSSVAFYIVVSQGVADMTLRVGDIKEFRNQTAWRDLKALYFPHNSFEAISKKAFDALVDRVLAYAKDGTEVDDSADVTFLTQLDEYLSQMNPPDLSGKTYKEKTPVTRMGMPFTDEGYFWFQKDGFVRWMRDRGHNPGVGDIAHKFRKGGLKRKTINLVFEEGGQSSKSYYYIRRDVLNDKIRRLLEDGGDED